MMRSGAIKGAGPFFSGREPHVPAIQSYPTPKQIYLHVTPPTGNSEEALKSVRITGGLTRTLYEAADGAERGDDYKAAVRRLADEADEKIQRLRLSRGRAGRPPKDAFWQLAADLVRVYERLTGKEAKKPQWKGGSKYGGDFYDFVIAVERCLRAALPQVRDELPVSSPSAVGDGLRKKWIAIRKMAGEKPPPNKTQ
jgi:hypothetical protein